MKVTITGNSTNQDKAIQYLAEIVRSEANAKKQN